MLSIHKPEQKSKPKKNRAERKKAAELRKNAASLTGLLYNDLLGLVLAKLQIKDVLSLAQTCKHLYLSKAVRSFISLRKPNMKWKDGTESEKKQLRRLAFKEK